MLDIVKQEFGIEKVKLNKGLIKINRSAKDGRYNYAFLEEYFSSSKKTPEPSPFTLNIDQIQLSQIDFQYDDYRKARSKEGIDWDHLSITNLTLSATDFLVNLDTFHANINELKLKEKSGFTINQLAGQLTIDKTGIQLIKCRLFP
jgi:hypothetical protein